MLENRILVYVNRELPFSEDLRSTKRTIYRIADPFLRYWFRYINPNRSLLELGLIDQVYETCMRTFSSHVGGVWKDCARMSTAFLSIDGIAWKPALRWWGNGLDRIPHEIDIVAESFDGSHLLFGEVKWEDSVDIEAQLALLKQKAQNMPFVRGRELHFAVWVKNKGKKKVGGCGVVGPDEVLGSLRR